MTNLLFLGGLGGFELLIILLFFLVPGILWIIALIDVLKSEFRDSINKLIWVLVIIFFPIVGAIIYFVVGRSQKV
jgi:hypothetical protein